MALQYNVAARFLGAVGLWLWAGAAIAASPQMPAMPLGSIALPPAGFIDFCTRQPEDCGADPAQVLTAARRADAERQALLAPLGPQPAALGVQRPAVAIPATALKAAPPLLSALVEAAPAPGPVDFVDPAAATAERRKPTLGPALWSTLNRVNAEVNGRIVQRTDIEAWGEQDLWSTPLKSGLAVGDCEDFVLEKRRALLAAGLPPRALNIAVVVTRWGETHAVLLVDTNKGEFVLDNLSRSVTPWRSAPYQWRQRQVDGEAFNWAMADRSVNTGPKSRSGRLLIADRR